MKVEGAPNFVGEHNRPGNHFQGKIDELSYFPHLLDRSIQPCILLNIPPSTSIHLSNKLMHTYSLPPILLSRPSFYPSRQTIIYPSIHQFIRQFIHSTILYLRRQLLLRKLSKFFVVLISDDFVKVGKKANRHVHSYNGIRHDLISSE